ncbi:MAG TPA: hypothetical protein VGL19_12215 [Polyangiaceae bacterium]
MARASQIATSSGIFSIHHLAPEVFGGYEEIAAGIKLASAEKALFDFGYLSAGRSRLFTSLPELRLPGDFRPKELKAWIAKIPSGRARTVTQRKLDAFLAAAVH